MKISERIIRAAQIMLAVSGFASFALGVFLGIRGTFRLEIDGLIGIVWVIFGLVAIVLSTQSDEILGDRRFR